MTRSPDDDRAIRAACQESLANSRSRRAFSLRARSRRRRTHGGASTLAIALGALALAAPLTLAAATSSGQSSGLLTAGSHGSGVIAVQRALGIATTGSYDAVTRRAVRAFQRRNGLLVDGIVGPQTRRALGIATAPAVETNRATGRAASAMLARIAACESGGNPRAVSAGGLYRGKYQFSRATWRALGGTGDPARAPEAVQDRMAAKLLARSGTTPWPSCA